MADMQALEAAVKAAGESVRQVKADKGDIKPALESLAAAKSAFKEALEAKIAEIGEGGDAAVLADLRAKLDTVTPKSRKDKKKKAKADKAAAAAKAQAQPSVGPDGEKKMSKSEMKKLAKMQKKAAMKAENAKKAAAKHAAAGQAQKAAAAAKRTGAAKAAPAAAAPTVISTTPYAAMIVASMKGAKFNAGKDSFVTPEGVTLRGSHTIARYFAYDDVELTGKRGGAAKACSIHQWSDFVLLHLNTEKGLAALDAHLEVNTYVVGYTLTLADVIAWGALRGSSAFDEAKAAVARPHLARWFRHCGKLNHFKKFVAKPKRAAAGKGAAAPAAPATPAGEIPLGPDGKPMSKKALKKYLAKKEKERKKAEYKAKEEAAKKNGTFVKKDKKSAGGKLVELQNAVEGEVMTRFPPEPSGYLHVGHVKAIMLNDAMARKYKGKLLVRFDDTNPSKEKEEFTNAILADLKRLKVTPDKLTYTSDSFDMIRKYAIGMIKEGIAYMDDTPGDKMSEERGEGIASKHRDASVETNMKLFNEMCTGSEEGQKWCMRAKIDMQCKNKCMRDPVFYRANLTPHARTGTKYKAYPIYDLACPIVDSHEGVTHAMRTTEYKDRDEMYDWVLKKLKLRHVHIQEFSRINFMYTLMSKRKLQKLVDEKAVEGWNDPRFPTVQGILRRGLRVDALRDFILSMGFSKRVIDMTWDKIWAMNRKFIDPDAKRYFAVNEEGAVRMTITNLDAPQQIIVPFHPKDPTGARCGMKTMTITDKLFLEQQDCTGMAKDEEITLMKWGNVFIRSIERDAGGAVLAIEAEANPEGNPKTTKKKVAWVPDTEDVVRLDLHEYGHLLTVPKIPTDEDKNIIGKFEDYLAKNTHASTVALGEPSFRDAKEDDILQIERRGFFRIDCDFKTSSRPQLFMVPDGKAKAMGLTGKLSHA
jgi:glutamyl-tRNA synthetase